MLFWQHIRKRLRSLLPLGLLLTIGLCAPLLSNDVPILEWSPRGLSFPVLQNDQGQYRQTEHDVFFTLHPPIPYAPNTLDLDNTSAPPLRLPKDAPWYKMHWLGTDEIGRDTLAHLIHGCRNSVLIAMGAMAMAMLLGLVLGATGGYWFGRIARIGPLSAGIALFFGAWLFTAATVIRSWYGEGYVALLLLLAFPCAIVVLRSIGQVEHRLFKRFLGTKRRFSLTFSPDGLVTGLINFFTTLPAYFALLAFLAIWPRPNGASIAFVLGLLMWPDLARLTRSAMIRVRQSGLEESAQSLGYTHFRVLFRHLLPNAMRPALAALAFGVGSAIMAESFLAFVGVSPADLTSWGAMLGKTRAYPEMWWLSVFPGIAILLAILIFYRMARSFNKPLRPSTSR